VSTTTPSNLGYEYREQLDAAAEGRTVLEYLADRYRHSSEACWRERLGRGELRLGGAVAGPDQRLHSGQLLCWSRPPWREEEVPLHYAVVHEDATLLVVSKPSGLPTVPAGGFLAHTLLALVRQRDPRWAPMHRLGRGTSGLVVFARTAQARARLQAAWREGRIEKRYRALASGALPEARLEIAAPIGTVEHPLLGRLHAVAPAGRPAYSEVQRLDLRGGDSLAEVRIATGRPHQIRIHLAYVGHPLVGDPLYGEGGLPRPGAAVRPGELGYLLHAWRLSFEHPDSRVRVDFEAPPPASLG
jgi:23S rRNA pseudouridine1911/1915/1917 synthase